MGTHANQPAQTILQHDIDRAAAAQPPAGLCQPDDGDPVVARKRRTQCIGNAEQVLDALEHIRVIRQRCIILVTTQAPSRHLPGQGQHDYLVSGADTPLIKRVDDKTPKVETVLLGKLIHLA